MTKQSSTNKPSATKPSTPGADPLTVLVKQAEQIQNDNDQAKLLNDERFANLRSLLQDAEKAAQVGLGKLRESVGEVRHLLLTVKVSVSDVRDFLKASGFHAVRVSEFLTIAQSAQADFDSFMRREVSFGLALETARLITMGDEEARTIEAEILDGVTGSGGGDASPSSKKKSSKPKSGKGSGKRGAKPKKPIEKVQAAMLKLVALANRLKVDHCIVTVGDYKVTLAIVRAS